MGTLFIQQILNNSLNTYYAEKSWDKVSLSSFYREGKWGRETNLSKVKMPLSEWKVTQSDSLWPRGLYSWWNSPGQNTGVGSCSLLQAIFPTQELDPGLPHCRKILYQLSHQGSPFSWVQFSHSVMSNSATPWTAARQASLFITNSQEFTRTHAHWIGDAIQPSHSLLPPSLPALSLSQHQGHFQRVGSWLMFYKPQSLGLSVSQDRD